MADAERATRIKRRFLEAIEAGDFAQLPDGLPSRGFVRLYARFLGMDEDQAMASFDSETNGMAWLPIEPVPPQPERQPMQSKFTHPLVAPTKSTVSWKGALPPADDPDELAEGFSRTRRGLAALDEEDGAANESLARMPNGARNGAPANTEPTRTSFSLRPTPVIDDVNFARANVARAAKANRARTASSPSAAGRRAFPAGLGGARVWTGVAVLGVIVVAGWLIVSVIAPAVRGATAAQPGPRPTVQVFQTAEAPVAAVPGAGVTAQPAVIPTRAAPLTPVAGAVPPSASGLQVALDALERAWVRVRVDGAVVFEGIPLPGPTAAWQGRQSIGIETGNAGAFEVLVNGQRLGRLGERNATLKRTWDASGAAKDE